jgi:6-phosphogluconolactonase
MLPPMFAYVGCYTTPDRKGRGEGIAVYRIDPDSGTWSRVQLLADVPNPSFLTIDRAQRFLYCVHGGNTYRAVSAFAIAPQTGRLTFLNTQDCGGANPVHLDIHPGGRFLVVASYTDGMVASLPINADGTLGPRGDLVAQTGEPGPHPVEQADPHPHHDPFDPAGRFVAVPDKGLDRTFIYRFDAEHGKLLPGDPPSVAVQPGAGPRHAAFHPRLPYTYVINELDSTITTFRYDAERGVLDPHRTVSTLPPDFTGANTTSEIAIAPSGRFLYGSNRGHDSIAVFAIDQSTGALTAVGWEPSGGNTPRFFALDPSGTSLYAANQESDTIVAFRVDQSTGLLAPTGQVIQTGCPVCIVFAQG